MPPAMTAIPERKARFIREAKAALSLRHRNIVTIFEIGAEGGARVAVRVAFSHSPQQGLGK